MSKPPQGHEKADPPKPIKHNQVTSGFTKDLEKLEELAATDDLAKTSADSPTKPVTLVSIGDIENLLEGRGLVTMTLIFALPFIQPIPIPGLSIFFGLIIFALGLKLSFGTHGRLPEFVRKKKLDPKTVQKMARGGRKIFSRLERLFRPRLSLFIHTPGSQFAGLSLMICGIAMSLPLPPVILFSNSLPALAVILICLGIIERDGLFVFLGHLATAATWIYFAFWWEVIWYAVLHVPYLLRESGVWNF